MKKTLKTLQKLYYNDSKMTKGMRKSGVLAEKVFLDIDKTFKKNNATSKTDIDLVDHDGKLWDLKLCSAQRYGYNIFHEFIQNTSKEYWSMSDTLNDKAEGWIYWDMSDDDFTYYTLDRASLETYLDCSLKDLKDSFLKKKKFITEVQPTSPSMRCLSENVSLTRGGFYKENCKGRKQAIGIKLPAQIFKKNTPLG